MRIGRYIYGPVYYFPDIYWLRISSSHFFLHHYLFPLCPLPTLPHLLPPNNHHSVVHVASLFFLFCAILYLWVCFCLCVFKWTHAVNIKKRREPCGQVETEMRTWLTWCSLSLWRCDKDSQVTQMRTNTLGNLPETRFGLCVQVLPMSLLTGVLMGVALSLLK